MNKLIVVGMRFIPAAKDALNKLSSYQSLPRDVLIRLEDNKEATGGKAYAVYLTSGRKLGYVREADLAQLKTSYNSALSIYDYLLVSIHENYLVLNKKAGVYPIDPKPINEVTSKSEPEPCTIGSYQEYCAHIKETKSKEMNMFDKIIANNKNVAVTAAYMEAGRVANNQVTKLVAAKAPLMVRGYIDTPVGKLVLANLTSMAVDQFRPADAKLKKVANAMMANAYQELIQLVDIEGMIAELVNSEGIKKALVAVEGQEIQS